MRHFGLVLAACLATAASAQEPAFQSIDRYMGGEAERRAWYRGSAGLIKQFDFICPDTICEGEFSNWNSIDMDCAVEAKTRTVTTCAWQFYGSNREVHPDTGAITFEGRDAVCSFAVNAPLPAFLSYMEKAGEPGGGYDGLRDTPLPGQTTTLWDVLVKCL